MRAKRLIGGAEVVTEREELGFLGPQLAGCVIRDDDIDRTSGLRASGSF